MGSERSQKQCAPHSLWEVQGSLGHFGSVSEQPTGDAEAVRASAAMEKMAARKKCMMARRVGLQWKSYFPC